MQLILLRTLNDITATSEAAASIQRSLHHNNIFQKFIIIALLRFAYA